MYLRFQLCQLFSFSYLYHKVSSRVRMQLTIFIQLSLYCMVIDQLVTSWLTTFKLTVSF